MLTLLSASPMSLASRHLGSSPPDRTLILVQLLVRNTCLTLVRRYPGLRNMNAHPGVRLRVLGTDTLARSQVLVWGGRGLGGSHRLRSCQARASLHTHLRKNTRTRTYNLSGTAWRAPYLLPPSSISELPSPCTPDDMPHARCNLNPMPLVCPLSRPSSGLVLKS